MVGCEAMGVAGSAWGTTISRLLQTTLLLIYVRRYEARLIPRKNDWLAAFKRKEVVRFTLIALPLLFHDGLWAFGMLIYGFLYAHLGTDSLAIMTTLGTLESILISLFFGLAAAALGDAAKPVVKLMASSAEIMLKVTGYVMNFAPFAVFGAIAAMVAKEGLGILATYGTFMAQFYLALACLWLLLIAMGSLFIRRRILTLLAMIRGR